MIADAAAERPQHPGRAVDEFGQGANDPDRKLLAVLRLGNQLDEFQPFDAIIVAMGKEIPRNQIFEPSAQVSRGKHRGEHYDAAEQHRELEDQPPIAAEPAQQHRDNGDGKKEAAARAQGRGVQDDLARDMDVDPPLTIAGHRQGEQRRHKRRDDRAAESEPGIDPPAGDKGVGEQETTRRRTGRRAPGTAARHATAAAARYCARDFRSSAGRQHRTRSRVNSCDGGEPRSFGIDAQQPGVIGDRAEAKRQRSEEDRRARCRRRRRLGS